MKKTLFLFCATALIGVCGTACEKNDEPVDMPFTEYSLANTSSRWITAENPDPSLVIINSDTELSAYIDGTDYPSVDFTTKTLLLAHGIEGYANAPSHTDFQQLSEHNYVMTVNLWPNAAAVISEWQVTILIDKLSADSQVTLNITRDEQ